MAVSKVTTGSKDMQNENLQKLREVFPQFVQDGVIDFEGLKEFFDSESLLDDKEKYKLTWAGKSQAFENIRQSATGTLAPDKDSSKNWEETGNIFIEGDNLEVLKLLQKQYREKIKMIYIDPPYNTGKDFVYSDNFRDGVAEYYEKSGQREDGYKMTTNSDSSGRYYSNWLTMMYPRLFLARNLLKEDGVIFVSIDDNEVANLRLIMDEIFGEENFVGTVVWKTATDNNPRKVAIEHEYIIVYQKRQMKNSYWSIESDLKDDVINYYNKLKNKGLNNNKIETEIRKLYKNNSYLSDIAHYKFVDESGVYFAGDLSNSSEGGYNFEYIHPVTNKKIKKPKNGYRFPEAKFFELVEKNQIVFGDDHNKVPQVKKRIEDAKEKLRSVIYKDGRASSAELVKLMGDRVFDNPKDPYLLEKLIRFATEGNDLILDFFAGSGTTAEAVFRANISDGDDRKFIMCQLPESFKEKDSLTKKDTTAINAYKFCEENNFENTISEISRERIRRAGEKILIEYKDLFTGDKKLDIGFKSYKLQHSNYRRWEILGEDSDSEELLKKSKLFMEKPLVDGYSEENVVYEIITKEGFGLNSVVTHVKIEGIDFWQVVDADRKILVSFATTLTQEKLEKIKMEENDLMILLDSALDDTTKINLDRNINLKVI